MLTHAKNSILHVDADSFFASVEIANNPKLRGKPVCVTGTQGGCVLASSYEAKARGVSTGMPRFKAEKLFKKGEAIFVPTTFGKYAQYSEKMFSIFHNFTPQVQEASVDEAYLDMTGLRRLYRRPYVEMARMIQAEVKSSLDLPVSIGVAPTKTLAKMASKFAKPFGVYEVPKKSIQDFLKERELYHVPGFGAPTVSLLQKCGIKSILHFTSLSEPHVRKLLGKYGVELWYELNGMPVYKVEHRYEDPKSLSRIRSFPLTSEKDFLYQQLFQHIVICSYKLRRQGLLLGNMNVYIRDNHFNHISKDIILSAPHNSTLELLREATIAFDSILTRPVLARATGVIFSKLSRPTQRQASLFDKENQYFEQEELLRAADKINEKYGMFSVRPASLFDLPERRERTPWMLN